MSRAPAGVTPAARNSSDDAPMARSTVPNRSSMEVTVVPVTLAARPSVNHASSDIQNPGRLIAAKAAPTTCIPTVLHVGEKIGIYTIGRVMKQRSCAEVY